MLDHNQRELLEQFIQHFNFPELNSINDIVLPMEAEVRSNLSTRRTDLVAKFGSLEHDMLDQMRNSGLCDYVYPTADHGEGPPEEVKRARGGFPYDEVAIVHLKKEILPVYLSILKSMKDERKEAGLSEKRLY